MAERTYALATGRDRFTKHWTQEDPLTWDGLLEWLDLNHPASRKDCGGFVLGELQPTPGLPHPGCKDQPCPGLHRMAAAVVHRSAVALDADSASRSFVADSAADLGSAAAFYTTWSHTPEKPRWRLLAPLSRDVAPGEYRLITQALMLDLGPEQFDAGSSQPERLMHRPSKQTDAYAHHVVPGDPLDADCWLARAKELGLEDDPTVEPFLDDSPERNPALGVHPYVAAAVRDELAKLDALPYPWFEGAHWDHGVFAVACNLVELANSNWSGYTLHDALHDLLDHAPVDDQWGDMQNRTKFLSALNKVNGGARSNPGGEAADAFDVYRDDEEEEAEPDPVTKQFPRLDLAAVLDPERPPRRWLWDDVVPVGDQASIVAPGGTGKSLLVLALCMAAVAGRKDFIGRALDFDGRVLYVDMENSEDDWAERLRDLGWDHESIAAVLDRFIPLSLPPLRGLDTREGAEQLKAVVRAYGIGKGDLLVLDSTQRVTEGEENSNDTLRSLYNLTSAWLKGAGITVLRTDNTGWDDSRERGASAKRDDVGYALLLKPVKPGTFRLINTKHRSKGTADALTFVRGTDKRGRLVFTQPVDEDFESLDIPRHQQDALLRVWMLTTQDDPRYEAEAVSQERALSGVPGKTDLKRNGLEQLVKDGLIQKVPYVNADGSPSKRAPGVALTEAGRAWIADQEATGEVDSRLDDIARRAQQ